MSSNGFDTEGQAMSQIMMFCADYGNIPSALYLAAHNHKTRPVTLVIPGNHDLFQFFQAINERVFQNAINLIYFESYPARRVSANGLKKVCHTFSDIVGERRYLKEIFAKYFSGREGCEVFFFSRGFSGETFYLLKKLSKRNDLVYMPYQPPNLPHTMCQYTPTNIVDLASLMILKLIYGYDIAAGQYPQINPHAKGFAYIPDKFMEKEVDRVISSEERSEMMRGFNLSQFKIFDAGNYSVIYFDDGSLEADYLVGKNVFQAELTEIFNVLTKHFPEHEIARKYHPGYLRDEGMIKTGKVLPAFIPAEFLYNDNVKMYLSICSFSIANVEKGLAVSVMDLVSFKTDKLRSERKEILVRTSKSKILFPKNLEEFDSIARNIANVREPRQAFTGTPAEDQRL